MRPGLHFDGHVDLLLDGRPAALIGQRGDLVLRVARVSDLRPLHRALQSPECLRPILHPLLAEARAGRFAFHIDIGPARCASVARPMKPDWLTRLLYGIPARIRWGVILRHLLQRSRQ